ncbi:MAG TPA: TIGR03086 family metal-binding protein [Acidimicrobiales bacterium]|nr:TIGR03086 family metal-binding protein [Acidimicrobiales bacterium]
MDPTERIELATQFAGDKVKQVTAADLAKPTPCSEFDVRALLNHMIGGLGMLTTAARGGKALIPEGDQFGEDPGRDYDERRQALVAALREPGVYDRNWEMPFGSLAGQMMGAIAFMEHVTHGWDVAKATGQNTDIPPALVSECVDVVTPMDAMLRMPGVCGPAVAVPDDASPQDKFVAFMGRRP